MKVRNIVAEIQPTVNKVEYNAWIVEDDLGNPVNEGEQVFVLNCGATIHLDATEDYLIEKLQCKVVDIVNWAGKTEAVFLLPNGTWFREDDTEDYFIEVLGAHVYERKSIKPKQK